VLSLYDGREVGNKLATGAKDWNVRLRVVGPRLYVFNAETVTSYHVVREDESWSGTVDTFQRPFIRDFFLGKQHVVLLDQPTAAGVAQQGGGAAGVAGDAGPDTSPRFRLLAYGRYPTAQGRGRRERQVRPERRRDPPGRHSFEAVAGGRGRLLLPQCRPQTAFSQRQRDGRH
jgi:hypothetical protein